LLLAKRGDADLYPVITHLLSAQRFLQRIKKHSLPLAFHWCIASTTQKASEVTGYEPGGDDDDDSDKPNPMPVEGGAGNPINI